MVMGGSSHPRAVALPSRASRRTFLLGAGGMGVAALGGAWAVDEGLLPGGARLHAVLGRNDGGAPVPDVPAGNLVEGAFASPARHGARTGWTICWPHGIEEGTRLPVLVMLHGHASDHRAVFAGLAMDRFLGRAVDNGMPPFAIASVDGGRDYWKPAPDGSDASRMVVEEFLPLLSAHGLDTGTLAIGGWSMGGYGSLRIAGLGLLPVRSVGTFAPALHHAEDDDDVLRNPARLRGVPVQICVGRGDSFYRIDREYAAALRAQGVQPEWHTGAGAHTQAFWRGFVPELLHFTSRHLAA
jgi:S-formylglutathione hydrolase FrmB